MFDNLFVKFSVLEECLLAYLPLQVFPIFELLNTFEQELMIAGLLMILYHIDVLLLG